MTERRRRRSVSVGVFALSAAGLAGCGQRQTVQSAPLYASVEQCAREHPVDVCRKAQSQSQAEQWSSAPSFSQQSVCEAQYGPGRCETVRREGSGSVFVPVMAGFMMGRMLNGGGGYGGGYVSHPVFSDSGGRLFSGNKSLGVRFGGGLPGRVSAPFTARGAIGEGAGVTSRGGFGRAFGGFGRGG